MSETMITQPSPDQLVETQVQIEAAFVEQYGDTQISRGGMNFSLSDYVKLRRKLCPVEGTTFEEDMKHIVGVTEEAGANISEDYQIYARSEPLGASRGATESKPDVRSSKDSKTDTEPSLHAKTVRSDSIVNRELTRELDASHSIAHEQTRLQMLTHQLNKRSMSRRVTLAQNQVKPLLVDKPHLAGAKNSVRTKPAKATAETAQPTQERTLYDQIPQAASNDLQPNTQNQSAHNTSLTLNQSDEKVVPALYGREIVVTSSVGVEPQIYELPVDQLVVNPIDDRELIILNKTSAENTAEYDAVGETITQDCIEFLSATLPSVAEDVIELITIMEPEALAEVEAQIELLTVVADRLHELVEIGEEASEEGQQIEAFLRREYELLLRKVSIEPTEELLAHYIHFLKSDRYQSRVRNDYEVEDEGTHEKKLFTENSVFSMAHQASRNFGHLLGNMIGRIALAKSTP